MTETTTGAVRPQALFFEPSPAKRLATPASETISTAALRLFAIATGATILAASTSATIDAAHLSGADARLVQALAAGVAAGAVIAPRARAGLAVLIIAALLCGEAFNLLSTAERIVTAREAVAASVAASNSRYVAAVSRVTRAEAALSAQRERAASTVATASCRSECRTLLQAQEAGLISEVADARSALADAPPAPAATPLADRLGVAPWALDLIAAALLSIGANGLAAVTIAWGARPGTYPARRPAVIEPVKASTAVLPAVPAVDLTDGTEPQPPKPTGGLPVPISPRTKGVLALIQGAGGAVQGSQRELADRAGISKSAFGRALSELEAAALVSVQADKLSGTRVALIAA